MTKNQKNLIFQFLENIYEEEKDINQLFQKEKQILKNLDKLKEKLPESEELIVNITDQITILNTDIKYKYFEYGIIAKETIEIENVSWKE